ncbi:2-acylglycerol O-acyltransferase 1-like [Anneissia japonica]|uniref:2-acylglycerol O-acyltransferase 1-like n=1 Tax=Anneissia japonica TaxID=1529436 RepID=UPI00142593C0|nr:2-acylglycerol O-acyltransferase 1-like [Anneissia japonica]
MIPRLTVHVTTALGNRYTCMLQKMASKEKQDETIKTDNSQKAFAPLNIPLHRRIETLVVAIYCVIFLFSGFTCLFISIYLWWTSYFWVSALYYTWMYYDWRSSTEGGRRWEFAMKWPAWRYMADFYPTKLHKTADLDPSENYLMGYHPHGVMSHGAWINFATEGTNFSEVFPGIRRTLLTLKGHFIFPVLREILLMFALGDVTRESLDYILGKSGKGNAAVIVIGGAIESLEARPNSHSLYLERRKGFVKKAIEHGANLVPIYSFGETDIYDQVENPEGSFLRKLQRFLTTIMGFAPPIFHGRGIFNYIFGIVPYRRPINTVVGKPIPVKQISKPTEADIKAVHDKYKIELEKLFNDHKTKYGISSETKLKIK